MAAAPDLNRQGGVARVGGLVRKHGDAKGVRQVVTVRGSNAV